MTGFIVSVFPFLNRVSSKQAFEELELGEGELSRPVLRGPGGRKAAWLLGQFPARSRQSNEPQGWTSTYIDGVNWADATCVEFCCG